jgi:putative transposase
MVFHILNRGVGRMRLFAKPGDYAAFETILAETLDKCPLRLCGFCLMPNHWHLVVWPKQDGQLAAFMQRLTITHARRWQEHRGRVGYGHVYQSRYKSFPVQSEDHFYQVLRYVERNPLRANLVERAEQWRWSSLWRRVAGTLAERSMLSDWPLPQPRNWCKLVNVPQTESELAAIRRAVERGQPLGDQDWVRRTAKRLGLESTLRAPHRPRKVPSD